MRQFDSGFCSTALQQGGHRGCGGGGGEEDGAVAFCKTQGDAKWKDRLVCVCVCAGPPVLFYLIYEEQE